MKLRDGALSTTRYERPEYAVSITNLPIFRASAFFRDIKWLFLQHKAARTGIPRRRNR